MAANTWPFMQLNQEWIVALLPVRVVTGGRSASVVIVFAQSTCLDRRKYTFVVTAWKGCHVIWHWSWISFHCHDNDRCAAVANNLHWSTGAHLFCLTWQGRLHLISANVLHNIKCLQPVLYLEDAYTCLMFNVPPTWNKISFAIFTKRWLILCLQWLCLLQHSI